MQKPFTTFLKLVLLTLALGTGFTSHAQVSYSRVPLTPGSFNADVIADGTAAIAPALVPTAGINQDVDGGGWYFISQDYNTASGTHTSGIPNSGLIPNSISGYSALTYQLAAFTDNNSLRIPATGNLQTAGSGTVVLATPTPAAEVYVMASSGSAISAVTTTVTYSDNSTTVFTAQNVPDWYTPNSSVNVFGMTARANSTAAITATASNTAPFFNQLKYTIPVDKVTLNIRSITFSKAAAGFLHVFAVSIGTYPVCSAAPTTQAVATTTSGGTTPLTAACSTTSVYLSLTGMPSGSVGYTYQWQSSPDNTTWAPISGATSPTYTGTGQAAATYYRCLVYCLYDAGNGATATPSGAVQVSQTPFNNCYCTPSASTGCGTYGIITSVAITGTSLSHSPGCISSASPGYSSAYYANYTTAGSPTATLSPNTTYTITGTVGQGTRAYLWIDYNQNGLFESTEATQIALNTATAAATYSATFMVPAGALTGNTRMRIRSERNTATVLTAATSTAACNATVNGESLDYLVTIAVPIACAGAPAATTATSTAASVCGSIGFTLNATGAVAGTTGLSYQWQSSPAGAGTFANLGTAQTASAYAVSSITASTDYRVIVTCTSSGQSTTSSVVSVARTYLNCYCAVVSTGANEYIKSVTFPGTSGFTNTTGTTPSTSGTGDFTSNTALTTTLNQGATYLNGVSVTVRVNSNGAQGGMWIDYDHSGTYDASEYIALGGANLPTADVILTTTLTVPTTAMTGPTRVRVRWRNSGIVAATDACTTGATNWYGETEDYLITIAAPTTCTAPPSSVVAAASTTSACANASFTLSTNSIPTTLGGYTFQWQSSPAGAGTFADISGATTQTYTVASQSVATDYQLIVNCQYGGVPVTSNIVSVGQNAFDQCYCTTSSASGCANYGSIANVSIGTLNNSSACAASPYHTVYPASTATTSLNANNSAILSLSIANAGSGYRYGVWIDFNQNGTFDASEFVASSGFSNAALRTATIAIPAGALPGATRMRVRTKAGTASYGDFGANDACAAQFDGETEDYTVTIMAPAPCSGTPPASMATATATTVCPDVAFALAATGIAGNITGLSYQWQSSPAGAGTFTNLGASQATAAYNVTSQTAATDYQLVVTCIASGVATTSGVVAVGQNNFANCYGIPTGGICANEYIRSVTLNTLSNVGTGTPGTGCTGSGYTDYSTNAAMTTILNKGAAYTISLNLRVNSNPAGAGMWIDYNQNGAFEASEYTSVYSNTAAASNLDVSSSASFTVPASAQTGATRMRVRSANSTVPITASTAIPPSLYYGEVEDYLVTIASPLPVELLAFSAEAQGRAVRLAWSTASEKNSDRFEVERSTDGKAFDRIGTVSAAGASSSLRTYALTDAALPVGIKGLYYRLRQVDQDGQVAYSPVRTVALTKAVAGLALFPNPAHSTATLTGAQPDATVQVFDVLNRLVLSVKADATGQAALVLPIGLPTGVYLVRTGREVIRLLH